MATVEQLGSEQRAVLELVLKRGQSYDDLSGVLGMSESRVRELARAALVDLDPAAAEDVDPEWRGQIGDYVLGQQTGPEARATRGHLKSSESARAWSRSLIASLDGLYPDGVRPEIPEPSADSSEATGRRGRSARGRTAGAAGLGAGSVAAGSRGEGEGEDDRPEDAGLSPAARGVVRRRRIVAAVVGAAVVIAVLVAVFLLSGGDEPPDRASSPPPPAANAGAAASGPRILAQIPLRALPGEKGQGQAVVAEQQGQRVLVVQAENLSKFDKDELLEVWFYNSRTDAKSIGAQKVEGGKFQGLGALPADYKKYRYIDLSREKADKKPAHSGDSVLRGALADAQQPSGPLPGDPGGAGATPPTTP